jgi:phage host-nuclease inhibitor protein Gam
MNEFLLEQDDFEYPIANVLSDADADKIVERIKNIRAEKTRLKMILDTRVNELTLTYNNRAKILDDSENFLTVSLLSYFEGKDIKPTKAGGKSYKLLSGTLSMKKQEPEFKRDEKVLAEFLRKNGSDEFIETVYKPKWAELKKKVEVRGTQVIDPESGVIIEGIEAIEREDKFEVKV